MTASKISLGTKADVASKTLVILGEAPGADEAVAGVPFVGASGKLLRHTLFPEANLDAGQWHMLNTFIERPPNNDLEQWLLTKTDAKKLGLLARAERLPPIRKKYLHPDHHWQVEELRTRLETLRPDVVICMGSTALWALTGDAAIGTHRGNFFKTPWGVAIGTFHPAAVLRQWSYRPLVWADLTKVQKHLTGTLAPPLRRTLWINPTFAEMARVYALFNRNPHWLLGVDIETSPKSGQITCISFSTATEGICIPIWDKDTLAGSDPNYWQSVADEVKAWRWIKRFAELPNPKVMQNGLYDMQYLLDAPIQIRVLHARDDTAILHHAQQPELPKALGTLASLFLNEPSWKQMRTQDKDVNKADD